MAEKGIAELLVETLAQAGVRNVYGLPGDSLNSIADSIRANGDLRWIHVRHEEAAAFAAGAEAHLTGRRGDELVDLARTNLFSR
jgi:thiamine pyrophosphate-dependent acetolactate synthase large subunit-like protein